MDVFIHSWGNKAFYTWGLQMYFLNLQFLILHFRAEVGCFSSAACRPGLALGRQSWEQLQTQETLSIDPGFPFLPPPHSGREGLFKITELVWDPLLPSFFMKNPFKCHIKERDQVVGVWKCGRRSRLLLMCCNKITCNASSGRLGNQTRAVTCFSSGENKEVKCKHAQCLKLKMHLQL